VQYSPQTSFAPHHPLKGSFEAKNSDMEELEIKDLFFGNYLSTSSFL
jgi:hypothetical protein